jgi:ribosomal protein L11 methyltransferase
VHWRQISLHLDAAEAARAEVLLQLAGAAAVAVADAADSPLLEPEVGATPLWPTVRVEALFPDTIDLAQLSHLLADALDCQTPPEVAALADEDWIDAWRQRVVQRRFERLSVVPAGDAAPADGSVPVWLTMGLAFGTGQHPTTALCLEWLGANDTSRARVLDYGAGSGVLAIAALKLGASAAWAVDIDPQALSAARENAALNDVAPSLWVGLPDALPAFEADLILANIVAGPLVALAPDFAARSRAGAQLVLSGILQAQVESVAAAYAPYYEDMDTAEREGWARLVFRRKTRT